MNLLPLKIPPGIVSDGTEYAAAGAWHSADRVRFRNNDPETIGGWTLFSESGAMLGVPRHARAFRGLVNERFFAVGTHTKFYIWIEDTSYDITPIRLTATLGADPFSFSSGLDEVTVTHVAHGATAGTYVTFSGATAAAGLTIDGEYEIVSVPTDDTYVITASGNASSTTTGGGAVVEAEYQINAGLADYVAGTGWGAGPWGRGGWGSGYDISSVGDQVRTWTSGNLGADLLFCPRGGEIYLWDYSTPSARGIALVDIVGATEVPVECNGVIVADQDRRAIGFGVPAVGETILDPMMIRWSTDGDYLNWDPTDTAATAGGRLLDDGREIVCGLLGAREILVWTDSALYTMQYNYTRTVFNIERVGAADIAGPMAMTNLNEKTFWMGTNNFYSYDGRINTLPCSVQDYVFSDLNVGQAFKFFAIPNSLFDEVWYFYCSSDSTEIDRYVIMRKDGVWSIGNLSRTAGVDEGIAQNPLWCSSDGNIYNHEVGSSDGSTDPDSALNAYIESGPIEIEGGNSFFLVRKVIPDMSFRKSINPSPEATISFTVQNEPGSAGTAANSVDILCSGDPLDNKHTRRKGVRFRGRTAKIKVQSDQADTAWRLGVIRLDAVKLGQK
jgi:hypothetical protein